MAKKPVLLCIMDGFGWVPGETYGNAVVAAKTPHLDALMAKYPMKGTTALSPIHPYNKNPERFVNYAGQLYFDPALPENRKYICKIVRDIVTRYDVDAIHMDDYFYPYPNPGEDFPDHVSFAQYGRGYSNKADWRRDNVNVLIKEIHETVRECKPWVKFGVSPFGIYRNKKNDPNGSDTRGLQNYDDLYADVLMWINNGWVDYNIPQIYWEIGHPAADYDNLIHWWAKQWPLRVQVIILSVRMVMAYVKQGGCPLSTTAGSIPFQTSLHGRKRSRCKLFILAGIWFV